MKGCGTDAHGNGTSDGSWLIGARLRARRFVRVPGRWGQEDGSVALPGWVDQQVGDERGPAGLVHRAETGSVVAVEVLVEQQVVLPRRVGLHLLDPAVDGSAAVRSGEPDADQPVREVTGDLPQRELLPGMGGVFDGELGAEKLVVLEQGADDQVVDGE